MRPHWWLTKDGDLDCLELYERHYSCNIKRPAWRERKLFVGPGEKLVLRSWSGDAVFVWRRFTDDCIQRTGERQQGVNCAVFRNEGPERSSDLIRQADSIADELWADCRHYTYVDRTKVASGNPGYCFLMAGWKRCGTTKSGLLILERITMTGHSDALGMEARSGETPQAARPEGRQPGPEGTRPEDQRAPEVPAPRGEAC